MRTLHLVYRDDHWVLTEAGVDQLHFRNETKDEAVHMLADSFERNKAVVSLRIHKKDGTFDEERTYPRSADPRKSPG